MEINNQSQKAGDGSQQFQIGTLVLSGISEERARDIFCEMQNLALNEYATVADKIATARIQDFKVEFFNMLKKHENLSFLADPRFQISLKKAQISSAKTSNKDDYKMLTELLEMHINVNEDRKQKVATDRAIEVVSDIDPHALCALSVSRVLLRITPISGSIDIGLNTLDSIFEKLLHHSLPTDGYWLDHLYSLGLIRISSFNSDNFEDLYERIFDGYVCVGILKNSDAHKQAIDILSNVCNKELNICDNELLDGYVRLAIPSMSYIKKHVSDDDMKCIKDIFNLYSKDRDCMNNIKSNFVEKLKTYKSMWNVYTWWNSISYDFFYTQAGEILAMADIERLMPEINKVLKNS